MVQIKTSLIKRALTRCSFQDLDQVSEVRHNRINIHCSVERSMHGIPILTSSRLNPVPNQFHLDITDLNTHPDSLLHLDPPTLHHPPYLDP